MQLIYKIVPRHLWLDGLAQGIFTGAEIDLLDGYIHFSTQDQVRETAAKHFSQQDNLLILAVDVAGLGPALRWETSRGGALFPHLYAPLDPKIVYFVRPLPLDANGTHRFPELV